MATRAGIRHDMNHINSHAPPSKKMRLLPKEITQERYNGTLWVLSITITTTITTIIYTTITTTTTVNTTTTTTTHTTQQCVQWHRDGLPCAYCEC